MAYDYVKKMLYRGKRKVANNTYLTLVDGDELNPEFIEMRLHGNLIAEFHKDHLILYSAGWYTSTTKHRLNMALALAGINETIYQHDYCWYYGCYYKLDKAEGKLTTFRDGMIINYKDGKK